MNIFTSIIMVIVPVFALFVLYAKVTGTIRSFWELKKLSPEFFNAFLRSRNGMIFVTAWAAFEAVYWYVFPDFITIFIAIFVPKKIILKPIAFAIFGTVLGGIIAYAIGFASPQASDAILSHTPFITKPMSEYTVKLYEEDGALAAVNHPFTNIPFKVFAYNAGKLRLNLSVFILISLAIRAARFFIFYSVFYSIGWFLASLLKRVYSHHAGYFALIVIYVLVFAFLLFNVSSMQPSTSLVPGSFANFFKVFL